MAPGKYLKPPKPVHRKLTPLQTRFVMAYVELLNVGAAAEKANIAYNTALDFMKSPHVIEEMRSRLGQAMEDAAINSGKVAQELAALAYACIFDFVDVGDGGEFIVLKSMEDIPAHLRSAISEISVTPNRYGNSIRVKMHDKMAALKMLAGITGLLTKKEGEEVDTERDYLSASPEALREVMKELAKIDKDLASDAPAGLVLPFAASGAED